LASLEIGNEKTQTCKDRKIAAGLPGGIDLGKGNVVSQIN